MSASKIFHPSRGLGHVSNHIPLQVRYIKSRKENLIVTCVGKSFHTYGITHFGLLSVGGLHPADITAMTADTYHVYTACEGVIYAWRRGSELKHTYAKHKGIISLMMPFGLHLISVDDESFVHVWDIKAETLYLKLSFAKSAFQISAILHPSTYVNKILLGSEQGALQLWNINTAKLIYTFKGWGSPVTCLEQAPAINVCAVGLASGQIVLHNLYYDETVMTFTQDWGSVTSISFRTDGGAVMATGSANGNVVFWDLEGRQVAGQLLRAHDRAVTGMVCLPGEPVVVTSSPDNTLKLWIFDMPDGGARLLKIREGHSASPSFIRFHGAQGHNILSAAADSTLRIFNTKTEQFNKSLGKASYNRKASKKRGRLAEDPLIMPPIVEFTTEVTREKEWDNIAAIHEGLSVVTTWSYDKIKMGDLKLLPERFQKKNKDVNLEVSATCVCITHCGNFVVVGYSTGHVDRFNLQSGLWRCAYGKTKAHSAPVRGVATDCLNQIVVSGGMDAKVKFWPFKYNDSAPLSVLQLEDSIQFFRAHHESSMLAIALEDFTVTIVDLETRNVVRKFHGHTAQLTDATFSPDSRWLLTSSMDCTIRTWDVPAAQLVDQFQTESACVSLHMSPTGEHLATAHVNSLGIFLWSNKSLYVKVALKALSPNDEIAKISLPTCGASKEIAEEGEESGEEDEFVSPEQISQELVTLSGLAGSRWQNLLNVDTIRRRNKPKQPPKTPKAAPFFLPTIPSLELKFDLQPETTTTSKLLTPKTLSTLSQFGLLLKNTVETNDFGGVIEKLKGYGPTMVEFEVKNLAPEAGGEVGVMLQFLKCVECVLKSNRDFELAMAYLGVFLKAHGDVIAREECLRGYLPNVQSCSDVAWGRIQEKLLYSLCVINHLKTV